MTRYAVDFVYNLADLFPENVRSKTPYGDTPEHWKGYLVDALESLFDSETYVEAQYLNDDEFKELFYNGILGKHFGSIIGSVTKFFPYYATEDEIEANKPTESEAKEKVFIPFATGLIHIYAITRPKYKEMLDSLSALKAQTGGLLKRPSSSSSSLMKYSDTPQTESNEATLLGNAHVTNVTRNESEVASDGASPAARFGEIADKVRNIYEEWSREFEQLFSYERKSR